MMTAAPDNKHFKNVLEVEQYLTSAGWKIKKSSIYNHVKALKLIPDADGTFTQPEIDRYANTFLKLYKKHHPSIKRVLATICFPDDVRFKNLFEVYRYLIQQGWKIKKSTFYKHASRGKLKPYNSFQFSKFEVDCYAVENLRKIDSSGFDNLTTELQDKKNEIRRKLQRGWTEALKESYIRKKLLRMGFAPSDITQDLIELKLQQIIAHRTLKEFKKWRETYESSYTNV